MKLDFARFRAANLERCRQFRDGQGRLCHPNGVLDWPLHEWTNAMAGEVGEACNVAKKIARGDFSLDGGGRKKLADELADVFTYADLAAARAGIALSEPQGDWTSRTIPITRATNKLAVCAGHLCEIADAGATPSVLHFSWLIARIQLAAEIAGIDLGRAIIEKFNEVSDRVGSDVKLHGLYGGVTA